MKLQMGANPSGGYFDSSCAKAELSYGKRPRDAPARRRGHRRPAIRDRYDEPLAQQED